MVACGCVSQDQNLFIYKVDLVAALILTPHRSVDHRLRLIVPLISRYVNVISHSVAHVSAILK